MRPGLNTLPTFTTRCRRFTIGSPKPIGAVSERESVTAELICDGLAQPPKRGEGGLQALSGGVYALHIDSIALLRHAGRKNELGGLDVFFGGGVARFADGTIAGSARNLYQCLRNAVAFGIPKEQRYCRQRAYRPGG